MSVCFEGTPPFINNLMIKIKEEVSLWAKAGALGLRYALLTTWDVH
jgi:hypothetical protein